MLDIETRPAKADVWRLFDNTVSLSQLHDPGGVIAVGAKWKGAKKVTFVSDFHTGHADMLSEIHEMWSAADLLIHFNGESFDLKHLRREFLLAGLAPPAPAQSVDLLRVVKKNFRFISNKLDHVSQQLGLGAKVSHSGHSLWVRCAEGDPKAWALMKKYCIGDVNLTDALHDKLLPWHAGHPNVGLIDSKGSETCHCGSANIQWRGWAFTQTSQYRRFQCTDCGSWGRATSRETGTKVRGI